MVEDDFGCYGSENVGLVEDVVDTCRLEVVQVEGAAGFCISSWMQAAVCVHEVFTQGVEFR